MSEITQILFHPLSLAIAFLILIVGTINLYFSRRSSNLAKSVAEAARPNISLEIVELADIKANSGIFQSEVTFEIKNNGGRHASEVSHSVFYLYKAPPLINITSENAINLARQSTPQFEHSHLDVGNLETITQPFAGEVKEALSGVATPFYFKLILVFAIGYKDDLTQRKHWTIEMLPIARINSAGDLDEYEVDSFDFVLSKPAIHKLSFGSHRS